MPCLPKGLKLQDTAITKHGQGQNSDESRATLRTFLRRYEDMFDRLNDVTRARQGAPRSERMRGIDIKGIGQMVGKPQIERSNVLANVQAKRVRTILASMVQLIIQKGGVSLAEIKESFRPNNLEKRVGAEEKKNVKFVGEPPHWAKFFAEFHGNGKNTQETQSLITNMLSLYAAEFDSVWVSPFPYPTEEDDSNKEEEEEEEDNSNEEEEEEEIEPVITLEEQVPKISPFILKLLNRCQHNAQVEEKAEPKKKQALKRKQSPSKEIDRDSAKLRKKKIARYHAKLQADRNRVLSVAFAKTLLRMGKVSDFDITQSFRANNTTQNIDAILDAIEDNTELIIEMPIDEDADDLFGY